MNHTFTLESWQDDGWYIGKLKEVPGIFSQGKTIKELEDNIKDAYKLIQEDDSKINHSPSKTKDLLVDVP